MSPSDWPRDAERVDESHKGLKLSQRVSVMWLRSNSQLLSWRLWPDLHSSWGFGTSFQNKTIYQQFSLKTELTVKSKCDTVYSAGKLIKKKLLQEISTWWC